MKRSRTALFLGLGLSLAMTQVAAAQTTPEAQPDRSQQFPTSGTADPIANEGTIEDGAIDALKEMSNYLMAAKTLGIVSRASRDVVTNDGQRIQLEGTTTYKVRRPGFVIDYVSDIKSRRFIYDGKNFTVYSPKLGFYASAPAPGTNKEVLDTIYSKFGIALPLEDLFRWGDDRERRANPGPEVRLQGRHGDPGWCPDRPFRLPRGRRGLGGLDPARRPAASSEAGDRRPERSGEAELQHQASVASQPCLHGCRLRLRSRREREADPASHVQGRVKCAALSQA